MVFDSSKRQAFAARDPNGKEVLYVNHEAENGLAFSNTMDDSSWGSDGSWEEVISKSC